MPAFIAAEFGVLVFALGLFIFFWAAMPLIVATGSGIAEIIRHFPSIGDDLADWVMARTHDVEHFVQNIMEGAVHAGTQPFVDLMNGYANNRRADSYYSRIVMSNVVGALFAVAHAQQHEVTQPVVDTVNHTVTNNIENTNNYITQVTGVTQQYVDDSYTQLAAWANDAVQSVYQDVVGADTDIVNVGAWAEQRFAGESEYAQSVATQAGADALGAANEHTDSAVGTLTSYVQATTDWVTTTITADRTWTQDTVNQGINDVTDIATGLTTLVVTNVIPRVAEIEQDIEKCVRPLCDNGLDFIKGLGQLEGILSLGALFGFIVEAVTDPEGTANGVAREIDEITAVPRELFSAITSLGK